MNKTLKIGGMFALGILSILGIMFILAMFGVLNIPRIESKSPPAIMEPEQAIETEPTEQKPAEETPNSTVKSKWVVWDKTPAEQELKVGDWIRIEGWLDKFVAADGLLHRGRYVTWDWHKDTTVFGDSDGIAIYPNSFFGTKPTDRIKAVYTYINNVSEKPIFSTLNNLLLEKETVQIEVIGQIKRIEPPHKRDQHPNHWEIGLEPNAEVRLWKDE